MSDSEYQVFARKYRPKTFDDVLGQDHVVQTLRNAIEKDRLAHAYLFVGPRGTGKTSTARILAKALNCPGGPKIDFDPDDPVCIEIANGDSLDVLEIDGASNNGVDQVRDLRDTVKFAPSSGKFKIYYIDEVHMLTTAAFNALLKTLEEPPEHVKFIFATTEPQKILPTIISRCQRFDLRRIPTNIIADHLGFIAKNEGVTLSEAAAYAIAKGAEGGMRDAQSMLDQLVAFCGNEIEEKDVLEIFGFNSNEAIAELAGMLLNQDSAAALERIHEHSESGKDLSKLLGDLIGYYRHLLVLKVDPNSQVSDVPPELRDVLENHKALIDTSRLLKLIDLLAETDGRMKWAPNKRLHLEIAAIKVIQSLGETSLDDIISMVSSAAGMTGEAPAATTTAPRAQTPPPQKTVAKPAETTSTPAVSAPPLTVEKVFPQPEPTGNVDSNPTSEPEPEPEPEIAPLAGPVSGMELWTAARPRLIAERPLIETWLDAATFISHENHEVLIGFSSSQSFYRDSMSRHLDILESTATQLSGEPTRVRLEVRDEIPAYEPPEVAGFDPANENPAPASTDDEVKKNDADQAGSSGGNAASPPWEAAPVSNAAAENQAAGQLPPTAPQGAAPVAVAGGETDEGDDGPEEPEEDFYDDPLIKKAMEEFKASVVEPKP